MAGPDRMSVVFQTRRRLLQRPDTLFTISVIGPRHQPDEASVLNCTVLHLVGAMPSQTIFEDVLEKIGSSGKWQLMVFLWASIGSIFTGMHHLSSVFLGATPGHRCAIPGETGSGSDPGELQQWIPWDNATAKWSQCLVFSGSESQDHRQPIPCTSWVYSLDQFSTVVDEWDLVCGRKWLLSTVQSSYMFGLLTGSLISGVLSDQYGRKRVVCVSALIFMVSGVSAAFVSSYIVFVLLRFVIAASICGVFINALVLYVEMMSPRWRAVLGILYHIPFAVGTLLLTGAGYWVQGWRNLQLVIAAPSAVMLLYWWLLPESPRWLVMNNRLEEALHVCKLGTTRNQRQLPEDEQVLQMKEIREAEVVQTTDAADRKSTMRRYTSGFIIITRLIRTRKLRRISLICFYNWLVLGFVYLGIALDSAQLNGNRYLAIFLSGLAEIFGDLIVVTLVNRIGRRTSLIAFHLVTAVSMLVILAVPADVSWPKLVLGMAARLAASANFAIVFIYTAELYPTELRNAGLGASSACAQIGSMAAPYIVVLLNPIHWSLPSLVFGLSCFSAVTPLLSETNGRPLPDSVQHIELEQ